MQLNITLDEELHKSITKLSKDVNSNVSDIIRAALRTYCPEQENLTVKLITSESKKTLGNDVSCFGSISEVRLPNGNFWFGFLFLDEDGTQELFNSPFNSIELLVKTSNGRTGACKAISFSTTGDFSFDGKSNKLTKIAISGISNLN